MSPFASVAPVVRSPMYRASAPVTRWMTLCSAFTRKSAPGSALAIGLFGTKPRSPAAMRAIPANVIQDRPSRSLSITVSPLSTRIARRHASRGRWSGARGFDWPHGARRRSCSGLSAVRGRARVELERRRVHAVAKAGRTRPVGEDVTEVRPARRTRRLDPAHPERPVLARRDASVLDDIEEARPARARLELRAGVEQRGAADHAAVRALGMVVPVDAGERALGVAALRDRELDRGEAREALVEVGGVHAGIVPDKLRERGESRAAVQGLASSRSNTGVGRLSRSRCSRRPGTQ